jgi:hypothetical protein
MTNDKPPTRYPPPPPPPRARASPYREVVTNRHTLHATRAQQYFFMSARLLTPTWRVIVRIEMGGGWYWLYRRRASLGMPSKRVTGSGALRISRDGA